MDRNTQICIEQLREQIERLTNASPIWQAIKPELGKPPSYICDDTGREILWLRSRVIELGGRLGIREDKRSDGRRHYDGTKPGEVIVRSSMDRRKS